MLETAIVGGGLCGVALARSMQMQGRAFALFDARPRLGGRVLSVVSARTGTIVDLGATWYWPDTQPLMTRLIAELRAESGDDAGLTDFPQHDDGIVLHLRNPDKKPDEVTDQPVYGGARRLGGGMSRLIAAMAKNLPPQALRLGHVLTVVRDRRDHVALDFQCRDGRIEILARRVVLALPPRLIDEHVRFEPGLDEATRAAMRSTGTWMASRAKVVIAYDRRLWRDAGQSGNAFVTHEQAVIGEIFDACDMTATKAALGGFLALSPDQRQAFKSGLPLLMDNQMGQVFGPGLGEGEQHFQDWATEPFTCSTSDRNAPLAAHTGFGNPLMRRALWGGRLHLGSSETATHGAGYLEGGLEAAMRINRALARTPASAAEDTPNIIGYDAIRMATTSPNAASLGRFRSWVVTQADTAFDSYRARLNRNLALQRQDQLTQRAILEAVEEVYSNALDVLDGLPFDASGVVVEHGRSGLTPEVQAPFRDFMNSLFDDVIAFNRTSCALSNFPDEHLLSKDYVQTILRDIAAAWQEFSRSANALLLAKAGGVPDGMRDHPAPNVPL